MKMQKYDVFVSHATKDKAKYVGRLVEALKREGLTVFYDSDCISWGDRISQKVDEGLRSSKFAVVVISKNFIGRQWTEYELKTLLARQNREGRKIIMPILHGITKKQLVKNYPELKDILFKYSKSCSCEEMAKILKQEILKKDN